MNDSAINSNISNPERGSRIVLAATLVGAVLIAPAATPSWLALVAVYPAFTALMAWDPIYALFVRNAVTAKRGAGTRSMNDKAFA